MKYQNVCNLHSNGSAKKIIENFIKFMCVQVHVCVYEHTHNNPCLSIGDVFPDPHWMPEATDSTESCMYCTVFFPIYIHTSDKV